MTEHAHVENLDKPGRCVGCGKDMRATGVGAKPKNVYDEYAESSARVFDEAHSQEDNNFEQELDSELTNLYLKGRKRIVSPISFVLTTKAKILSAHKSSLEEAVRLAERKGELSQLKFLQHWQNLHDISIEKNDIQHLISSIEQFPDQPLASETLATLNKDQGEKS